MASASDPKDNTWSMTPSQARARQEKLPSQEWFNQQMSGANRPSYLTSQMAGYTDAENKVKNFLSFGLLPTAQEKISSMYDIPQEGVEKMMNATYNENPLSYMFGQGVGYAALPVTATLGLSKTLAEMGIAAATPYVSAAVGSTVGPIAGQLRDWMYGDAPGSNGAAAAPAAPPATERAAPTLDLGGEAPPAPQDKYKNFKFDADPAVAAAQRQALSYLMKPQGQGPTALDRDAALTGGSSVAEQYWRQIHNPDGTLVKGISREMEAQARKAIEFDAVSAADGSSMRGAVPEAAFPARGAGAQVWQNQYGEYDAVTKANGGKMPALAAVLDSPEAVRIAKDQQRTEAAARVEGQPFKFKSFSQVLDEYNAMYPKGGGPLSEAQLKEMRAGAAAEQQAMESARLRREQDQREANWLNLGAGTGMTREQIIALGNAGQLSPKMIADARTVEAGRPIPRPRNAKDLEYERMLSELYRKAAIIEGMPVGPERSAAEAALQAQSEEMRRMIWAPSSLLPNLDELLNAEKD